MFRGLRSAVHVPGALSGALPAVRSITNFGIVIVPQQSAYVVERFGKFRNTLEPGLHFLIPFVDRIQYNHNLKETALNVPHQAAITKDNVCVTIDGVLYVKIVDPYKASYGVTNVLSAISLLAQTTMRSEIGKLTLDRTFEERESLNHNIVHSINEASCNWGIDCKRYEIRDISPPPAVRYASLLFFSHREAMESQANAERQKRSSILLSEGSRQSTINKAEGVLSEIKLEAEGRAQSILMAAEATSTAIRKISAAIAEQNGDQAMTFVLADKYVEAFSKLAKENNTMILPADVGNVPSMIAQCMGIVGTIQKRTHLLPLTAATENGAVQPSKNEAETPAAPQSPAPPPSLSSPSSPAPRAPTHEDHFDPFSGKPPAASFPY